MSSNYGIFWAIDGYPYVVFLLPLKTAMYILVPRLASTFSVVSFSRALPIFIGLELPHKMMKQTVRTTCVVISISLKEKTGSQSIGQRSWCKH